MLERLVDLLGEHSLTTGGAVVFAVLLLCGFGLPMPEDVVLVTAGVLSWLASPLQSASFPDMLHDSGLLWMIVAGMAGFKERPYFEAEPEAKKAPQVRF